MSELDVAMTNVNRLLGEVKEHMREGFQQYGTANHRELGLQGQFSDIWRKIGPLKRALWEGYDLPGEPPRQILLDLVGHCFLTIMMIDEAHETKSELPSLPHAYGDRREDDPR